MSRAAVEYLAHMVPSDLPLHAEPDPAKAKRLLLTMDAEVLRLYDLPPRLERQLLDLFEGHQRSGVPFTFISYYPPDFRPFLPLHMLLSEESQRTTVGELRRRATPETSETILRSLAIAVEAFREEQPLDAYLLDTNILEYWFNRNRNEHAAVMARVAALPPEPLLYVSPVTLGEIEYGYECQSPGETSREMEFRAFLAEKVPSALPIDRHTSTAYGSLRAAVFERFAPQGLRSKKKRPCQLTDHATATALGIDENDLWIAAQAVQHNLVLVTNDGIAHIRAVLPEVAPTLPAIENWTEWTS